MSETLARTFASVRKHRNYRLYFGGQAISFTGSWMQQIAASWLLLAADALGGRGRCARADAAAAGDGLRPVRRDAARPLRGAARRDRRARLPSLVMAATLAALTLARRDHGLGDLRASPCSMGIAQAVGGPARHALVFEMVGPEDLANAVGLNSSLGTRRASSGRRSAASSSRSPAPGVAFGVNSVSFLAEVVGACSRSTPRSCTAAIRDHGATVLGGALDALRFVVHTARGPASRSSPCLALSTFSFNFNVLLPLVAEQTLDAGAQTFGLIAAVFGAGALVGATSNATRGQASLRLLLLGALGLRHLRAACSRR